jgi:hypothetical protein
MQQGSRKPLDYRFVAAADDVGSPGQKCEGSAVVQRSPLLGCLGAVFPRPNNILHCRLCAQALSVAFEANHDPSKRPRMPQFLLKSCWANHDRKRNDWQTRPSRAMDARGWRAAKTTALWMIEFDGY